MRRPSLRFPGKAGRAGMPASSARPTPSSLWGEHDARSCTTNAAEPVFDPRRESPAFAGNATLKATKFTSIPRFDRDDDDRGVVDGARGQHAVEQPLGGDARRGSSDLARDVGVGDHVGQAVAAQEKAVAGGKRLPEDAEFEPAAADRLRYDMRLRVPGGLVRRQQPGFHKLLHMAVIDAQLPALAVAPAIGPAVPGPQHGKLAGIGEEDDDCAGDHRGRAEEGRASSQLGIDLAQTRGGGLDEGTEITRGIERSERGDDAGAGVVAGFVAAHPVGHRPKPHLRAVEKGVLVAPADQPDMGQSMREEAAGGHGTPARFSACFWRSASTASSKSSISSWNSRCQLTLACRWRNTEPRPIAARSMKTKARGGAIPPSRRMSRCTLSTRPRPSGAAAAPLAFSWIIRARSSSSGP